MDHNKSTGKMANLAELKLHGLGKVFMEPNNYDRIPLCKILYSVRCTGLLTE
jgi:hypothetical protein